MKFKSILLAIAIIPLVSISGCEGDNPGKWPAEKVQAQVIESANLTELNLAPSDQPGVLTGSGKDEGGETFQITVTQDAAAKEFKWEAKGDRGTTADGSYGL